MAQALDLKFFPLAKLKCLNCSSIYNISSTIEDSTIEVCGNCHPFYTGQDTLIDSTGRIDKFMQKMAKAQEFGQQQAAVKKVKLRKIRQTLADLDEGIDENKE